MNTKSTVNLKNSTNKNKENYNIVEISDQPYNLNVVSFTFNKNIIIYAKNNGEGYITDGNPEFSKNIDNKINLPDFALPDISDISFKNVLKLTGSLNKKYVVKVLCGRAHVIFMTHAGMVFSFGDGSKGQLGHSNYNNLQEPTMITSLLNYRFTDIVVGGNHNWGLASVREISKKNLSGSNSIESDKAKEQLVFVWGDNKKGQLGIDVKEFENVNTPMLNGRMPNTDTIITNIQAGLEHTLVMFDNEKVYGVGSNEYGQINPKSENNIIFDFSRIRLKLDGKKDDKIKVKNIKASAFSSLISTDENYLYIMGKFNNKSQNYDTNNSVNSTRKSKRQTILKIDDQYDGELDFIFTDDSLILFYDSNLCAGIDLKYEEIIQNDSPEIHFTKTPVKESILTEEEKLTHSNLRNNIKNIKLNLDEPESINFGNLTDLSQDDGEFEQENEFNASKFFILNNSSAEEIFDSNASFEQSIEELRSYINLVGISYVADPNTTYSMSFRPKNLPKKTPQEESYHRKLVEENRKKYVKFLKEKQEEEKKMKAIIEKRKLKCKKLQEEWENQILPNWVTKKNDQNFLKKYFYDGIPANLRGKIWLLCIGNNFSITHEYYDIEVKKAIQILIEVQDDERKMYGKEGCKDSKTDDNSSNYFSKGNTGNYNNFEEQSKKLKGLQTRYNIIVVDKERSIQFIELDIDRTFSYLGIFKSHSPLSEDLREILRAFVSSRPDIGYVTNFTINK
jgi:hypothetical protein